MSSASRLLSALACTATLALAGSTSAVAASAGASADGQLAITTYEARGTPTTEIDLRARAAVNGRFAPTAAVVLRVPRGYVIDLGRPPGTAVGSAFAVLVDASGASDLVTGLSDDLVADDPAAYSQDAAAQSCAPGEHAAVWRATSDSIASQPVRLLVFVDPVADGSDVAYTLRLCPLWPRSADFPGGLAAPMIGLGLEGVKPPAAPGIYTWSAFVTPGDPDTLAAQPDRVFELRAVRPQPHKLTLRARYEAKARSVVLSGRLTAAGKPEPGVAVTVTAYTGTYDFTQYGAVKTNAEGAFSLRRAIDRTTVFAATAAAIEPRACTAPSSAPAGCLGETVAPPTEPTRSLRISRPTDARRALRKRDQALARRATLQLRDFPSGWRVEEPSPFAVCEDFQPDVSDLTVTGESVSQFSGKQAVVRSTSSVYRTEAQARTAFRRNARLEAARCLARDLRDADAQVLRVETLAFPQFGDETRAFRIIADFDENIVYFDIVSLRGGRTDVAMLFVSLVQPLVTEQDLVAKVASRLR